MTTEECFDRIEHITAGLAEEHREDREENRQLWRDTQRQIGELAVRTSGLTLKVADTNDTITRLAEEDSEEARSFRRRVSRRRPTVGRTHRNSGLRHRQVPGKVM